MNDERIEPTEGHGGDEGDDVAETRSPDAIQKEIEQTRTELAETIDAIADRISPKRAASRGAAAVKAQVTGAFGGNGKPASVLDAPPAASGHVDSERRREQVREIAQTGGGSAYTGSSQYTVKRTLRVDRVLVVVGVAAAIAGVIVLRRSRSS